MLNTLPRVGICTNDIGFNVIYLVALLVDQHGDVHEDLMELQQMLLDLFHCVMPFLNLSDSLNNIAAPLFPYCFLQKSFTLTGADHVLNGLFVCILPCDSVIPAQTKKKNPKSGLLEYVMSGRFSASNHYVLCQQNHQT